MATAFPASAGAVPGEAQPTIGVTVRDVMTRRPTCVRAGETVLQLVRTFHEKQFRHLLVTDEGDRVVGIVSDRDVVRCFGPTDYPDHELLNGIKTEAIMSRDVITIDADRPLIEAIDMMSDQGVSSLPVLDDGRLVGIVTTSDLTRLLRRMLVG